MKKLNKLQINPDKILKSDELIKIKGKMVWVGDCAAWWDGHLQQVGSYYFICDYDWEADQKCEDVWRANHPDVHCFCNFPY
jgi:hypothetical protein